MDIFILPDLVVTLCFDVLLLSFGVYLVSRHWASVAARWLAACCLVFVIMFTAWSVPSLMLPMQVSETLYFGVFLVGMGALLPYAITLQQFAYTFRGNPYVRESRIMLGLTGVLSGLIVVMFVLLRRSDAGAFGVGGLMAMSSFVGGLLASIWTLMVLARKTVLFSRDALAFEEEGETSRATTSIWHHLRYPHGRAAQACRVFLGVASLPLLIVFFGTIMWGMGLGYAWFYTLWITCVFLFIYALIVAYVTYTPEPTTVQVKLVGTVLATVLLFLALVGTAMYSEEALVYQGGGTTPEPHTLRFEPDAQGGYTVTRTPPVPARPGQGKRLPLGDDDERAVAIGFSFPFYGTAWDSMYVSANGAIGLGGPVKGLYSAHYLPGDVLHGAPKVIPFFADFNPMMGGVFVEHAPEQVRIIWYEVGLTGSAAKLRYTVQATLHRSGTVELTTASPAGQIAALVPAGLAGRGLVPGGEERPVQSLEVTSNARFVGSPGVALVEDFAEPVYRYGHRYGKKLLYLLVAATLFCLLVLPFVFRASLLRPLARLLTGLQQLEKGNLDTAVNIPTHDEVGQLAQHFNSMTHALRKAEHQLQDYAATLEEKVDARTAALTQSLEQLKAAQARLVQAEKMASLGALTAGIAHEIKNPLNFVNNFAELSSELVDELHAELDALNGQLDAERRAELEDLLADLRLNVQKINLHGRRADGIVQAMLLHSRGAEGERRAVDLNALVEEYISLSYHGKRAQMPAFNATIEKDLDASIGQVDLVPQDFGRVLLNLLGNAFDAVYERAAQSHEAYAPTVTVSTRRVGEAVEIRVEDNGPGIPESVKVKIFEPFFTTKPTGVGTGLGLSLSYDIVTQGHGGTLLVESVDGQGAAFVVTLPASRGNPVG